MSDGQQPSSGVETPMDNAQASSAVQDNDSEPRTRPQHQEWRSAPAAAMVEPVAAEVDAAQARVEPPAPVAPVATPRPAPAASSLTPARAALPAIASFELPLGSLQSVVDGAGLQWVQSDTAKVAAAQEAIRNTPKPVHVPRERKPVVLDDFGPLVLVETRKDLSQVKLPFDANA